MMPAEGLLKASWSAIGGLQSRKKMERLLEGLEGILRQVSAARAKKTIQDGMVSGMRGPGLGSFKLTQA